MSANPALFIGLHQLVVVEVVAALAYELKHDQASSA
jgi:hypothetical protein